MSTALIILAEGFEEIEAISVIDILRRGKVEVVVAGLEDIMVEGAHKILVQADVILEEIRDKEFDVLILPGGEPGTTHLQQDPLVIEMIEAQAQRDAWIAAICAAPRILDQLGLLKKRFATSFPGTKPMMQTCKYLEDPVVVDGMFITSRGAGTAMAFGYMILELLTSSTASNELKEKMVYQAEVPVQAYSQLDL